MEKPTRIIEQPTRKRIKGVMKTVCKCDNGKSYTSMELGEMVGITTRGFELRLRKHGWQHTHILTGRVADGKTLDGSRMCKETGNDEYHGFSRRDRSVRLLDIPGPGVLEQKYLNL